MATKKHDLGVVTDLFQNGGQIRREFKLGRFLAVIEKTYPNRTLDKNICTRWLDVMNTICSAFVKRVGQQYSSTRLRESHLRFF